MRTAVRTERRTRLARWSRTLEGTITLVVFTESGRMHRTRLSRRLLIAVVLLLLVLLVGSATSVLRLFRDHVDLARMTYLEQENRSLTSLLEGQAEQVSRLKLEVGRLKEFEQNLRVVSGMDAPPEAANAPGHTRGEKKDVPRKR
jgi:hypothetical protein